MADATGRSSGRSSWFDEATGEPLIETYVQRMDSFVAAMADGIIDDGELEAQEERLVAAMREIEPRLDDETHALVTRLLCELTAYDLMQTLHELQRARPRSAFRG